MTKNNIKTGLFTLLIVTMILPFAMMNISSVSADVTNEDVKTDQQRIDEYDRTFGDTVIHEGDPPLVDVSIGKFAPITEIPDHMKIDVIKSLDEAKNTTRSQVEIDFEKEQVKVHKTVKSLMALIAETEDMELKNSLKKTLDEMKPRIAKSGIFLNEDKDNKELRDIFKKAYQAKQDESTVKDVIYDESTNSYIQPVSHSYNWDIDIYVDYTCEPLTCSIGPGVWWSYGDGAIIHHTGTIPNSISTLNVIEWFVLMDSNYHEWIYQGTYHQGIHYDNNWNFKSGNYPIYNLWYAPDGSHTINTHTAFNGNSGDKVYSYLYIY